MSYDTIKRVNYNKENNSYFITSSSSSDDIGYQDWECNFISEKISKLKRYTNKQKMDLSMLTAFIGGDFQGGNNIFTKTLKRLLKDDKFIKTYWRQENFKEACKEKEKMGDNYYYLLAKYLF